MSMKTGTSKRVAKITLEAPVVSFRHPHFLVGRQPTFDMPPPSTILGAVASAVGSWPAEPVDFAYVFRAACRASDLEHQQILTRTSGKFPGNVVDPLWRPPVAQPGSKSSRGKVQPRLLEKTTEALVQPHVRDFLFDAVLELYLEPASLATAFRSPAFTMVLGRSQDLASVRRIEEVSLEPATSGYVEHTILPIEFRKRLPWGTTTLMPRCISPTAQRDAVFSPYIVLRERVYVGAAAASGGRVMATIAGEADPEWFAEATESSVGKVRRLLWFHRWDPREVSDVPIG